jgi:uncharacterized Rmd1/YagE family protein
MNGTQRNSLIIFVLILGVVVLYGIREDNLHKLLFEEIESCVENGLQPYQEYPRDAIMDCIYNMWPY